MTVGYVKFWRSSFDNEMYFKEKFTQWQAWSDLVMLANYRSSKALVRGINIPVERGQVLAGEDFLARRWKWSRGKVRRFCSFLESETVQQIRQQKNNVCSLITIINYDKYQSNDTADDTANSTTDGQQTVQQTDTLKKNIRIYKEEAKNKYLHVFDELWKSYPNKDGKEAAIRHFKNSVKSDQDVADIIKALTNYLESDRVKNGYIKNGSTWFNNWRDWVVVPECRTIKTETPTRTYSNTQKNERRYDPAVCELIKKTAEKIVG